MLRLLLLVLLATSAFLLIEARWSRESLTLTLRVRTAKELVATAQGTARRLGARAAERVAGDQTPAVSAPPPAAAESDTESLREADRARLNHLVEEKGRER